MLRCLIVLTSNSSLTISFPIKTGLPKSALITLLFRKDTEKEEFLSSDRPKVEFTEDRRFGRRWRQPNLRTLPKVFFSGSINYRAITDGRIFLKEFHPSTLCIKPGLWHVDSLSLNFFDTFLEEKCFQSLM